MSCCPPSKSPAPQEGPGTRDPRELSIPHYVAVSGASGHFLGSSFLKHQMPSLEEVLGEGISDKQNPQAVWEPSRLLKFVGTRGSSIPPAPGPGGP